MGRQHEHGRQQIASIQALRALASLAVAAFHINILFSDTGGGVWLSTLLSTGWLGVDVFFVLSGFIMWYSTTDQTEPGRFLARRLTRVYPALWAALALTLVVGVWTGRRPFDLMDVIRSATLLDIEPTAESMYLYVTWTLTFELAFYAAFALLLAVGRRYAFAFGALTVLVVEMLWYLRQNFELDPPILLVSRHHYEFIFGVIVAAIHLRGDDGRWLRMVSLALGASMIAAGGWVDGWHDRNANVLFIGGGTALLLYGVLHLEPLLRNRAGRVANTAGDWSYAMYLLHPALIYALAIGDTDWELATSIGPVPYLLLYLALVVVVSGLFYRLVEQPLLRASRRLFTPRQNGGTVGGDVAGSGRPALAAPLRPDMVDPSIAVRRPVIPPGPHPGGGIAGPQADADPVRPEPGGAEQPPALPADR